MEKDKYEILDFFGDGNSIIAIQQEMNDISKVLDTNSYMFITSERGCCLTNFFMHALISPSIKQANVVYIVLRVPYGKRDLQEDIQKLIDAQRLVGVDKCTWSVIEDVCNLVEVQAGILAY